MTTDLVSRLRAHAGRDNCVSHDWGGDYHDAGEDCEKAADQLAAARWIPITESLPPSGQKVLVFWKNELGKGRRTCAEYVAPRTRDAEGFWEDTDDDWFDVDESGTSWVPAGWYERTEMQEERQYTQIDGITHWMPLPEMPA